MKLTSKNTILGIITTFGYIFGGCDSVQPLDLVIHNGTIYTLEESNPGIEAIGVLGDTIHTVGSYEELKPFIGEETKVLDLDGKTLTPGWIEGHGHFMGMGYNKLELDLREVTSYQQLVDMVAEAVSVTPSGSWILGRGWHQSKWLPQSDTLVKGFQTHDLLSSISPDHPVYLRHASGHAGFANAKAMEIAGINNIPLENMPVEAGDGGEIIRDGLGNPTGVFNERAMTLITRHIPETSAEKDQQALKLAVEQCLKFGITSFQDAGIGQQTIDLYKKNISQGTLKVRIWAMLNGRDTTLLQTWYQQGPEIGFGNHHLTVRAIKMYMDGALGSRGAWLLKDYSDRPEHRGHETSPIETLYHRSVEGLQHGFQVCAHAIGDRANREVLDQFEKAFKEFPGPAKDARFRIEHAQHLNAEDIPRFAQLGVIAAMQGIHLSSDRPWAIERLGKDRIEEGAYVWQKLLQSGAVVVNGSDVPVEPLHPLASFYASVTRKTLKGEPEGGYEPQQKMTRQQALRSYTLDAAYGAFEEDIKGSITPGKLADFTVFDQDIMHIPERELLETKVIYTIVGGEIYPQ